jgi:hypothetical protein
MAGKLKIAQGPSRPVIKTVAEALETTKAHLNPSGVAALMQGAAGMIQSGMDNGAIDKVAGKAMVQALEKTSKVLNRPSPQVVVSVAGGCVTGVMSDLPGLRATLFDFDNRVAELANNEFAGEPNSGKAAEQADHEFHEATQDMTDALVAAADKKGRVKR